MSIFKTKIFSPEGFILWQLEQERQIAQVSPLISAIGGSISDGGDMNMEPSLSLFVMYVEED